MKRKNTIEDKKYCRHYLPEVTLPDVQLPIAGQNLKENG
jgi:hypothetical protein